MSLQFWGIWSATSLPSFPDSLWPGEVVLVLVPPMGQIDPLEVFDISKKYFILSEQIPMKKQLHEKCKYDSLTST